MLQWIIQMSIISLILIILIHYLYIFFQKNLTIPKVKDLVNKPQKQYDLLFNVMKEHKINNHKTELSNIDATSKEIMKMELKNYLKDLSVAKQDTSNNNIVNKTNENNIVIADNLMPSYTHTNTAYSIY